MNHYEFEVIAKCPNGALLDRYDCILSSGRVISAESINAFAQRVKSQKLFQEDLADAIRNEFQARVILIGMHYGVKITCIRK